MAGPVGAQQPQIQGFLGVRERDDECRVPPDALVGDVHSLLGRRVGLNDRGVRVDDRRLREEGGRLAAPHLQPGAVDRLLQGDDRGWVKAPAEVPGGRRVRQALDPQAIEEHLVAAARLDVLQALPPAQGVVGDVQDVIGLVVGLVQLEQVERAVDLLGQVELADQLGDHADPAVRGGLRARRELIGDIRPPEHRPAHVRTHGALKAPLDRARLGSQSGRSPASAHAHRSLLLAFLRLCSHTTRQYIYCLVVWWILTTKEETP